MGKMMTEEEYDALDEYYTKNPPKINTAKQGGFFTDQRKLIDALDKVSADYIMTRAMAANKMPVQIIGEIVRERIVAESKRSGFLEVAEPSPGYGGYRN